MRHFPCAAVLSLGAAIAVAGCGGPPPAKIVIDGSSTVRPLTQQAVENYRKQHPQQEVEVGTSSTGAGLARFCAGSLDIADASRHITAEEAAACEKAGVAFLELPIAYDAISVVVNPKNTWATSMTVAELKTLWEPAAEGKVTKWSQIRKDWPDREVHLFGPDAASGTFDYFTEIINGKTKASRKDYTANPDHAALVTAVEGDELGLAYLGYTYFERQKDKLRAVGIDDLDQTIGPGAIEPSALNVRRGTYRPLSRTLFLYAKSTALDREEVRDFLGFYTRSASEIVEGAGGVRLNSGELDLTVARLNKRTLGTMFVPEPGPEMSLQMILARNQ
jgi:phosphate transport system substrate-binding protein